jgi:RNA polymerase sigma-70 factor (ECF subfamily)
MQADIQLIWRDLHLELRRFILGKVGDEILADDLLQETFLKIHLGLDGLKDGSKLTSWVYQITRNVIIDHHRKARHDQQIDDLELVAEREPTFRNLSRCINEKIRVLPEKYREAILLTTFREIPQTELADYLGISYSGAKSRVQRGRENLTRLVADCDLVETSTQGKVTGHDLDE